MATFLHLPSPSCSSLLTNKESYRFCSLASIHSRKSKEFRVRAVREKTEEIKSPSKTSSPEDVTKKYGLEAGLWKVPVFFSLIYFGLIKTVFTEKFQFHVYVSCASKLSVILALNAKSVLFPTR